MKKLSKITICLFMILSFLFVGNVKADSGDDVSIDVILDMVTKEGGKEACPSNSYVCIMGLSAIRITPVVNGTPKSGYNVFDTNTMKKSSWETFLKGVSTSGQKTRFLTDVSHREYFDISSLKGKENFRLNTKSKQNKFYNSVKNGIKSLEPWTISIINSSTGQNYSGADDKNLSDYLSKNKIYFVIEPLYYLKVQDLEKADSVNKGATPSFNIYLYTANQIGQKMIAQTQKCQSTNNGLGKCKTVYEDRSTHPHTKKIATNMYLKKNQSWLDIQLKKGEQKSTYQMKDLVKDGGQTGLGVGLLRLKSKNGGNDKPETTATEYYCYKKESGCDDQTYNIYSDVSDEPTVGDSCKDRNTYSDSSAGVIATEFLKNNQYCHVYCKKNIEFKVPESNIGVLKVPWATINNSDNFTLTKSGTYDCKIDFEYFYGEPVAWEKKTIDETYNERPNRITKAQAILAQTLYNVRSTRDSVCPGKSLQACAIEATARACPTTPCASGNCSLSEINACVNSFGTDKDGNPNLNGDPDKAMAFHYSAWINNWKAIKNSYSECANFKLTDDMISKANKMSVTDDDGNDREITPEGGVTISGANEGLSLANSDDMSVAQDSLAASYECSKMKWTTGNLPEATGNDYKSICLLKKYYEKQISERGAFTATIDYTYKLSEYQTFNFNLGNENNSSQSNDPTQYNSVPNKVSKNLGKGGSDICTWNNEKVSAVVGQNTQNNDDKESTNNIIFNLKNDSDAKICNFNNVEVKIKKDSSSITCACPSSTVHAGTNAYYWINNDLLKDATKLEKFRSGATCAEAISMVCRDTSLSSDPNGYEEPTDLNGKSITNCLIAGIEYQKCVEHGAEEYTCKLKNKNNETHTYYIGLDVFNEAKKRKYDLSDINKIYNLSNEICKKKNDTCQNDDGDKPAFIYRTVQLNGGNSIESDKKISFPGVKGEGRTPGSNWSDNDIETVLKTDNANYNGTPMYTIILDSKTIEEIRKYNKTYGYDYIENLICDSKTTSACVSSFVHDERYGIQKNESKCGNVTSDPTSFYSTGCVNYYERSSD